MNIRKRRRIYESDEESNLSNINSRFLQTKKRIRILELSDSTTDEDDATNFRSHYENNDQKIRKSKRNKGEKYYTKTGNIIPAKKFENKDCKCKKLCEKRITESDRISLFHMFWKMADFNKQNTFLCASTQRVPIKRRRGRNFKGSARDCSYKYFLNIEKESISVCKKFFIDTFDISIGRLHRALKAKIMGNDLRGKMKGSSRKSDEKLVDVVKDHIKSFPHYEIHYTRSNNPNRKYLRSDLNLRKMYNMYVENCEENHTTFLSERIYRKIFKNNFNLSFHPPHKDTCQKCDYLYFKIKATTDANEKSSLLEEHNIHLEKAELARKALKEDQNLASMNPDKYFAFSFDLQKALPYPKLTVSVAYYKRNMYVLNEGFHNFHDNRINMYVWEETVASRGAEEIASCCLKHIQTITTQDHIIAYSDMCTGQNRNIKLALMWLRIVQSDDNNINVIDHKFLLSGHSFLPNDRDFAVVETALKKKDQLYTAEDYYNVIKACRKKTASFCMK